MMLKNQTLYVVLTASVLAACSTTTTPKPDDYYYKQALKSSKTLTGGSEITVTSRYNQRTSNGNAYPAESLHIVHRTDRSKVTALKTVSFIASMVALQGASVSGTSKNDLVGSVVPEFTDQSLATAHQGTLDYLAQRYAKVADTPLSVDITLEKSYLVYENFNKDADNTYRLVQNMRFNFFGGKKANKNKDGFSPSVYSFQCQQDSAVKPLAQWEADRYVQVHKTAAEYVKACLNQLKTEKRLLLDDAYGFKIENL